jgi:hypothetical protein
LQPLLIVEKETNRLSVVRVNPLLPLLELLDLSKTTVAINVVNRRDIGSREQQA